MSVNIKQIKAMFERTGKTNLLQKPKVDLDKERFQLEAMESRKHKITDAKIKIDLPTSFMNYLDRICPEGKMCLSNAECSDIDKAFDEMDWDKLVRYLKKYLQFEVNNTMSQTLEQAAEEDAEHYFPELKESEDERIRKAIVTLIEDLQHYSTNYAGVEPTDMLAYLEKQKAVKTPQWMIDFLNDIRTASINKEEYSDHDGWREYVGKILAIIEWLEGNSIQQKEQKPANEPKFKVGDWLIFAENHNSVYQIERVYNCRYYLRHYLGGTLSVHFDNELIRQWTIQDAKPGDVLVSKYNYPFIYNGNYNDYKVGAYCGMSFTGEQFIDTYSEICWTDNKSINPATKEQRDFLFSKMKEAGYEWNAEHKQLKKIEQKPAEWSEEDKKNFELVIECIYKYYPEPVGKYKLKDWLNSLKDRGNFPKSNTNSPSEWSEEDKKDLDCIIDILERLGFEEYCKSSRYQDIEEERFYYKEIQFLKRLKSL